MHPGGIKFGFSQDLLELRCADVVVSARFLENISAIARRWIRRRKRAMPQWEDIVGEALYSTPYSLEGSTRQEHVPFYMGLDRVILPTMMPIAEEAGMGKRSDDKYVVSSELITRVNKDTRSIHAPTLTAAGRVRFRKIYTNIICLCRENAPQHLRHAELLAICELNRWMTWRENRRVDEFMRGLFTNGKFPGED